MINQQFSGRGYGFGTGASSPIPDELDEAARNHRSSAGWKFAGGPGRAVYAG